jgi:hypothetical protein
VEPRSFAKSTIRDIRRRLRTRRWRPEYQRLRQIEDLGVGRRAFLVGSGPSLGAMDLSPLDREFVCVVNMGVRAVGSALSHADMHVITDTNRYRRFAAEIEAIARKHPIPYRFLSQRVRRLWRALPDRANEPFYLVSHVAKVSEGPDLPPIDEGVVRAGSVLLTAAVLLDYLGFSPIYVIGCDLDYETAGKYFYELGTLDVTHENDPKVIERRPGMVTVDEQFAILRRTFEGRGHRLFNAGIGGKLESLERVDFATLF